MTKTQKLLAAVLVSLGMAHSAAFAQVAGNTTYGNTTAPVIGTSVGDADGATASTTTINSGYDNTGGSEQNGNVVIQALNSAGTPSTIMNISTTQVGFSNASGGPVKVTGVANGTSTYDAVNYGQLMAVQQQVDTLKSGIASVAAMANIPTSNDPKQRVSIGAGVGGYMGRTASAIGATVRITKNLTAKASFSSASGGESTSGIGIAYGW